MSKKTNILIFNPDEMRSDSLTHLGNPAAITPFLDRFANTEAVSFRNAYCQNPVCVPSRCSFFTGLYPHVKGHRTMAYLLHPGEKSLFQELKDEGYYVWMNGRNDLYAGQFDGWAESHADELFLGGNVKKAPGPENAELHAADKKYFYSHYEGRLKLDENGKNYSRDDEIVDAAIDRILHPVDDRPLCMFLGLNNPHTPYAIEEPYFSAIDRSKLPHRILPEECCGKPKMQELIRAYQSLQDFTEQEWDELRATYLGMCMKIDYQFKRICDALKEAGIYDDTAIFFFSDHGDFTGDYGLTEKAQNCFEDCLTKVPLLIKPPKNIPTDPGVSDSLVELIDFYATAVDFAGINPNRTHFGKSLRPVLENRSKKHRNHVFCEGGRMPGETHCDEFHSVSPNGPGPNNPYRPKMLAQTDDEAHAKATMIRGERFKYISRSLGKDELYDLEKDPGETINLIDDPSYTGELIKLKEEMLRWYQATCDIVPFEYDMRFTVDMLWAMVKSFCPPQFEQEVKAKIKNGAKMNEIILYCRMLAADTSEK